MSKNLVTDEAGSPPVTEGNVSNREFDSVNLDGDFDAFRASLERQGVRTDHVEARPIEERELTEEDFYTNDYKNSNEFQNHNETSEQEDDVEELDTDDNSDEDSIVEADDETDVEEQSDPNEDVNSSAEIETLAYDDLFDQVQKVEIGGKEYTPAQLKSILGQEESAGKRAREAAEVTKRLETKEAELIAQEQWLEQRRSAVVQSDEMGRLAREHKALQDEAFGLDPEEHIYEISVNKAKQDRIAAQYNELKQQVETVNQKAAYEKEQKAVQVLQDKGYGYLLSDTKRSEMWYDYASKSVGMSDAEISAAAREPAYAIAIEKARRWDAAQKKDTKKLESSAKTLKTSGRSTQPSVKAKEAKLVQKIKSGQASKKETEAFLMNQGRAQFKA